MLNNFGVKFSHSNILNYSAICNKTLAPEAALSWELGERERGIDGGMGGWRGSLLSSRTSSETGGQ